MKQEQNAISSDAEIVLNMINNCKKSLEHLIRTNGKCLDCQTCVFCCITTCGSDEWAYKTAVEVYIELYGEEELMGVLL